MTQNAPNPSGNGDAATTLMMNAWQEAGRAWTETFQRTTDAAAEAQTAYFESLLGGIQSTASRPAGSGYAKAFQVWSEALQEANRLSMDALERGDAPPTEEIFDLWVNAYADVLRTVLWSPTYAAAQGRALDTVLETRRRIQENAETQLRGVGMPTRTDVMEVGKRLVELERRQHELTNLLKALVETQENITMVPGSGEETASGRKGRKRQPQQEKGGE